MDALNSVPQSAPENQRPESVRSAESQPSPDILTNLFLTQFPVAHTHTKGKQSCPRFSLKLTSEKILKTRCF